MRRLNIVGDSNYCHFRIGSCRKSTRLRVWNQGFSGSYLDDAKQFSCTCHRAARSFKPTLPTSSDAFGEVIVFERDTFYQITSDRRLPKSQPVLTVMVFCG